MRKINNWFLCDIIVLMTIWVYFSLNARYLNFPGSHILRWVFPGLLIMWGILGNDGKIIKPPAILVWISLAVLPSIFFSSYGNTAFVKYLSLVIILYGSYIFFCYLNNKELLVRCFNILILVLIIYQILNFIFVIAGINYDSGRALGITTNANTLGVYSNLAYWAIVYSLFNTKKKIFKIFYWGLLVTSVFTSIASGSRTAFIVLIINILITGFLKFRHSPLILVFGIGVALVAYLFFSGKMSSLNIMALNRLMEEGGTTREDLWNCAISVWREHQIFGVGYTVSNFYNLIERGMAFHNSYISYLVETGLWGVILLSVGFCGMIIRIGNSISLYRDKLSKSINELIVACVMAGSLLIAAWSESFLFAVGSTEGFTFWFLISWILSYINQMCYED